MLLLVLCRVGTLRVLVMPRLALQFLRYFKIPYLTLPTIMSRHLPRLTSVLSISSICGRLTNNFFFQDGKSSYSQKSDKQIKSGGYVLISFLDLYANWIALYETYYTDSQCYLQVC